MQVILLERIKNLGNLGDEVSVKAGFARNFLLPYKKGVIANAENREIFEAKRAELEEKERQAKAEAMLRAEKIDALDVIQLTAKVSNEGKLFGSITIQEIVDTLEGRGLEIEKSEVRMPEGPIRHIGEYDIAIQVHSDVSAHIKIDVVAEETEE